MPAHAGRGGTFRLYPPNAGRRLASDGKPRHSSLMSEKNLIGPKVSELRMAKGWTQAQLAAKLGERGWHCSADDIARIEEGEEPVSDVQFLVLGIVLEVDHAELFPSDMAKELRRDKPGSD